MRLAVGFALLLALPAVSAEIRYVSADGDDDKDGLSEATSWRTLGKLGRELPAGGEARLRRGDVFYGCLRVRPGVDARRRTIVTAWGTGPAPVISGYLSPSRKAWRPVGKNLWSCAPADDGGLKGNAFEFNGNIGFLLADGVICGRKFFQAEKLAGQWDFFDDHRAVIVWSRENPAVVARELFLAPNVYLVHGVDHLELRGLDIRGTGGHGFRGTVRDVRIVNCSFREIGGSHLTGEGGESVRYGNGIECWAGSSDVTVSNCVFSSVYDVAFTMQGPNPPRSWENVHVTDCVISNCTQAFEIWTKGCAAGIGFRKCSFERNLCVGIARGWGYEARPDKLNAVPLLTYALETDVCDLTVRDNRFENSRGPLIGCTRGLGSLPRGYQVTGNVVVGGSGTVCNVISRTPADFEREKGIWTRNTFRSHEEDSSRRTPTGTDPPECL